jgi:PAS domain S-box-containing protein
MVRKTAKHQARYMALAERVTGVASWSYDPDTDETWWSPQFFELMGYEPNEIVPTGTIGFSHIHPDDVERAAQEVQHTISTGENYDIEKRIIRKDGEMRIVRSVGELVRDNGDTLLIGAFWDITNSKKREAEKRRAEQRYQGLFENMPLGVCVWRSDDGIDWYVRDINSTGKRLSGVTKDVIGMKAQDAFPGIEEMGLLAEITACWKTFLPREVPPMLYEDSRKGGYFRNWLYPLDNCDVVAIYQDVTTEVQIRQSLVNGNAMLQSLLSMATESLESAIYTENGLRAAQRYDTSHS